MTDVTSGLTRNRWDSAGTVDPAPSPREVIRRALVGFVALVATLSMFGFIGTLIVFDGPIGAADYDVVDWIAERRVGLLDSVATIGSSMSDTFTVLGVIVGAGAMLWVAGHPRHAVTICLAVALEFATFLLVGAIIDRSRPDVETLGSVPSTPSFPSGHVAAAFVLYGSLVLVARSLSNGRVPRLVWLAPLLIALLVAAARVYEGVHHPIDVAAGLLLGIGALVVAADATGVRRVVRTPNSAD